MNGKIAIGIECPGCNQGYKTPWAAWCHLLKKHPHLRDKYYYPTDQLGHKGMGPKIGRPKKDRKALAKVEPKPEPAKEVADPDGMPLNYCPCCGTNLAVIATVLAAAGKVVARG